MELFRVLATETGLLALTLKDNVLPLARLDKSSSLLGGEMVLQILAAGIEEDEFVSSALTLEDFLNEMSATGGVAISDEQNGFRFRVPFDKRYEKGNEERDEK